MPGGEVYPDLYRGHPGIIFFPNARW